MATKKQIKTPTPAEAVSGMQTLMGTTVAFIRANIEAVAAAGNAAVSGVTELTRDALSSVGRAGEAAAATMSDIAASRTPTQFAAAQKRHAAVAADLVATDAATMTHKIVKLAGAVAQPVSERLTAARDMVLAKAA